MTEAAAAPESDGGPVVAIDGPAGSGKSTVAERVADELGVLHLDTGAIYRAVTLACLERGVDLRDAAACAEVAGSVRIDREDGHTVLDGRDVEAEIRSAEVTEGVSTVAAHPGVRDAVTPVQRRLARMRGAVVEGRDIGTVVLPDADLKVFLTASVEERARRRGEQVGVDDLELLEEQIAERDRRDENRSIAPLRRASDAWELDTTEMEIEEVVDAVVARALAATRAADPVRARSLLPRVAVVGRPNVGKSTLVNRILGERIAIVEEQPGVTRDRTEHVATWRDRTFLVVDTGGWEHGAEGMAGRVARKAEEAVAAADVVLMVVDVTVGALGDDERYARLLRRRDVPVILVANKADAPRHEPLVHELYGLGLGEAMPVSAQHGRGVGDLLDEVVAALPDRPAVAPDEREVPHVAVVGRPNVGKSSLFNRLLGQDRSIVDEVPHTTRDAVDTIVEIAGSPWVFVDTAGMRRRYRRGEDTELYSVDRTRRAVDQADLVLFVIDASTPVAEQDQRLAALVRDAGRGVVIACNKWDLLDDERRRWLERELARLLRFMTWAPRVNVSATSGRGIRRILPALGQVWDSYNRRITTRELNQSMAAITERHPPPLVRGRPLRIKYVTQVDVRPPRFVVFANRPLPDSYRRYLRSELRERFDFTGVPVIIGER